jgi:hypothetical protein
MEREIIKNCRQKMWKGRKCEDVIIIQDLYNPLNCNLKSMVVCAPTMLTALGNGCVCIVLWNFCGLKN